MSEGKLTIAQQLKNGQTAMTFTKGVSMQPLLYEGKTHVILTPVTTKLKIGELPIYLRPDGKYVIHRLIKIDDTHYYTRGDNCITYEKVPKEWVVGVVSEIYRKGRYIKVTEKKYRLYVTFWRITAAPRILLKKIKLKLSRIKNKLKG